MISAVEKKMFLADLLAVEVDGEETKSARPTSSSTHPILNPNTTKHDKARFIEMFANPNLVALWTEAFSPFEDRATLDDRFRFLVSLLASSYYLLPECNAYSHYSATNANSK